MRREEEVSVQSEARGGGSVYSEVRRRIVRFSKDNGEALASEAHFQLQ